MPIYDGKTGELEILSLFLESQIRVIIESLKYSLNGSVDKKEISVLRKLIKILKSDLKEELERKKRCDRILAEREKGVSDDK